MALGSCVDKGARGAVVLWALLSSVIRARVTTLAPHGLGSDGTAISYRVQHLYGKRSNEASVFVASGGKKKKLKKENLEPHVGVRRGGSNP